MLIKSQAVVMQAFNLRKQRQMDLCEFEASLVYKSSSTQPTLHRETLSLKATATKPN